MCLAVPGQVLSLSDASGVRMGKVNFGGIIRDVCLEYVPDIAIGDYAIVHVGFALSKIDEASARTTLATFREMGLLLEEELGGSSPEPAAPEGEP